MGKSNTVVSAYTMYRHLDSVALTHQYASEGIFEPYSFDRGITHYYTMPHFDTFKIYSCGKQFEKSKNCL